MFTRPTLLALLALTTAAHAQTRHLEATGKSLAIASPCARTVTIQPDATLHGQYILDARADHPEETARLVFDSAGVAKLHISTKECYGASLGHWDQSTLDLTLRVPAATALAIDESGGARYTIGAIGTLNLEISGGVQLDAASTADVALSLSGGAAIKIGHATGAMKVDVSGGGDIRVDRATLSALALSMSGGGAFSLGGGSVGTLALDVSGAGSVHVGAPVTDAAISMSGAGEVKLARVTGKLTKDIDGVGALDIGTP